MKFKSVSFFILGLLLMVFFASCSNMSSLGKTKKVSELTTVPQGVDVSLQNPPSSMVSSDQISISLSIQNKGDFTVPQNDFVADFVSPSLSVQSSGAQKTFDSSLSAATTGIGGMGQLSWNGIRFSGTMTGGSASAKYTVQYYYLYGTKSSVGLCLVDPKYFYNVKSGCNPRKIDISNSNSIVALTKVEESELTNGEYVLQFTFRKLDPGLSYYPFTSVADYLNSISSNVPKEGILVSFSSEITKIFDASSSYCFFDSGRISLNQISLKDHGEGIPLVLFDGDSATLSCRLKPSSNVINEINGQNIGMKKYINVKTEFVASGQLSGSITVTKQ